MVEKSEHLLIEEITHEILSSKKFSQYTIAGIILTGSYVHENKHRNSDIDIFVVVKERFSYIRHIVFHKEGKLVQVRLCSFDKFKSDCEMHENKRPASYACKVLFDCDGLCEETIEFSKKYLLKGPKKLSSQEMAKLVNTIKNEIETVEGLIESNNLIAATILINQLVIMIIEYYNNERGYWMSNSNYLFKELKEHDNSLGRLAEQTIFESNLFIKFENLIKMCEVAIADWKKISGEYVYDEYYGLKC